jgi:ferrous iron transport protein A
MTLAEISKKTERVIKKLEGDEILVARLRELGFIRGESVLVVGRAPFGEPILVEIHGATIALRKEEAKCVHL